MKDIIINALAKATNLKPEEINLEIPQKNKFGDYFTNVLLERFPGKASLEAQEIVNKLIKDKNLKEFVERIQVEGPGFINFYIKSKSLLKELQELSKKKDLGKNNIFNGRRIMVEYAHPNTHKLFHIGHLRNITTGEAIAKILEANGAEVIRVNYQGDIGLHVAKTIWGIKKLGLKNFRDIGEKVQFLAKAYIEGNRVYGKDSKSKEEIEEINLKLYEGKDQDIVSLYKTTREWSLKYFDSIYKRIGTRFDRFYFESEVSELGKKMAVEALKRDILKESQGAVVYQGEKEGLHTRVFVTSKDVPTYEAKDLGLAKLQFSEFNPDKIIHVVGPEQTEYFKVLFKVLAKIDSKTKGKEFHLPYGLVRLKTGKMSSRKGNVIPSDWLLDEVKKRLIEKYKSKENVSEKIAVAAVKYSFLKVNLSQELVFDIDESISLQGNSGPYLLYTFARTQSVLSKSEFKDMKRISISDSLELNSEELSLLREIIHFQEIIQDSGRGYSPNILCNFLYDLAQKFNLFYEKNRIIISDRSRPESEKIFQRQNFRLLLTFIIGKILKKGLNILGIEIVPKI